MTATERDVQEVAPRHHWSVQGCLQLCDPWEWHYHLFWELSFKDSTPKAMKLPWYISPPAMEILHSHGRCSRWAQEAGETLLRKGCLVTPSRPPSSSRHSAQGWKAMERHLWLSSTVVGPSTHPSTSYCTSFTENTHLARPIWDSSPEQQLEQFFHKNNNPSPGAVALFPFPQMKLPE